VGPAAPPTTAPPATTTAAVGPAATIAGLNPPIVRGFMTAKLGQVTNTMLSDMKNVWGSNVIRLQMYPREMASAQGKTLEQAWPAILTTLDDTVSRANAVGLKVIVDMHQAPFPYAISERSTDLWNSPDLEPYFVDAWNRIATKLEPRSAGIWGFDLFNEPEIDGQSTAPAQWRPLATKLTQNIHGIAPDIWVVWDPGPNGQARGYVNLTPLPDSKVIYTAHDYRPHEFTHQCLDGWPCPANYPYSGYNKTSRINQLKPIRDFQLKYNVPILIGEFSVIRNAPAADAVLWLTEAVDMYEANGWSWVYHAFREWDGWSLEHDNKLSNTTPVSGTTDRGAVIKSAMQKNNQQ
jgi:aryl-phospho-beta-D-glucosidase BglC (GH1 family)